MEVVDVSREEGVQELIAHSVRDSFISVDGFMFPDTFQPYIQRILEFEVYEDDIWICSFPKSGTTWTQELVWCLENNFDYDTSKQIDLDERMVFFEWNSILTSNVQNQIPDTIERARNAPRPRIIKSHLPYNLLPKQIMKKQPRIIHISRNVRDVCVSLFHHLGLLEKLSTPFELMAKLFARGVTVYYGPIDLHLESFYKSAHNTDRILFLTYEDMKKDQQCEIQRIANFLNHGITEDRLESLSNHLCFKNFKNTPSLNKEKRIKISVDNKVSAPNDGEGLFIRKGIVGDWKSYFNDEIIKEFDILSERIKDKIGVEYRIE